MEKVNLKIKLVIFSIISDGLTIYLSDNWLPSADIEQKVSLDKQVENLFSKTIGSGLGNNYVEQLYTTSDDKKEITIVYYVLLSSEKDQLKSNLNWKNFKKISKNISDFEIISYAVQRLQWKIEYTNVVYSLLPKEITLSELQETYQAILGQNLDKRNFRKKIIALQFLQPINKKRIGAARPAQIYSFKKRSPIIVKIFS
jgi:8-oxo-dGTP diphosphatase